MDIMKKTIYAAVAVLMMSGCSGSLGTEDTPSLEMKFELEYPGVRTKVAANGFVKGDIAGLYMTENRWRAFRAYAFRKCREQCPAYV